MGHRIEMITRFKAALTGLALTLSALLCAGCDAAALKQTNASVQKPNIVIIYMDDLGIGDVSAYGAGKLSTPGIDSIAQQGIKFTHGYATSATCTPSRYALLTGQYPWRNASAQILPGDAPLLIDPQQETLPKMLKRAGYTTAVIGKWHLGLGSGQVDWNTQISPSPNDVGFDYSYIMAATNDRVPNVYVQNGKVIGLDPSDPLQVSYGKNFDGEPTGLDNPELLTKMHFSNGHFHSINNGISRIGYQKGGKSAQWVDEEMSDLFLREAQDFVVKNQAKPFFLFYTLHQPHVPRVPHPRFAGKSGLGPRGDAILEADWAISEFLQTLDDQGLAENTLVIFSSDNGPVLDDGYQDEAESLNGKHTPWGKFRGGKYSLLEAGTHVPFMVRWRGTIEQGISSALISQHDLLASLAALTGQPHAVADSLDMLNALTGKADKGRSSLVIEGSKGQTAYREGNWILIPAYWGPKRLDPENVETGYCSCYQLYDISSDTGQQNNLAERYPDKVKAMLKSYRAILEQG